MNANIHSKIDSIIESMIKNQNPWHNPANRDWYLRDGALRELMDADNEGLYESPKIYYFLKKRFFKPLYSNNRAYGVLIIRGPRRIGKTSTLKYMIKDYIQRGYPPDSFVYISLDSDELIKEADRKRYLRELVDEIIKRFKRENKPLIIILDEVTFYKGWARAIKNLIDSGSIGPGIALVATGEEEAVDDEAEGGGEEDENEMMEIMKNNNKNPIRVLHVEDEKGALEITKLFLERKGQNDFEVTQALSAEQGLEKPENGNFDVVISDYRMPGMDGLEVGEVEELRKDDEGWIGEISTGKGRGRIYKRLREEG